MKQYTLLLMMGLLLQNPQATFSKTNEAYIIKRTNVRIKVDHKLFRLHFVSRSPQQIAAFYYARGFPDTMVNKLKTMCFITMGMTNKSKKILWLDIRQWKFSDKDGPLKRYTRAYWFEQWKTMKIPLRFQSTFRWTLLPTSLDYRPQEREGGNVTLQRRNQAITVTALIQPGQDRNEKPIKVIISNVRCANDLAPKPKRSPK